MTRPRRRCSAAVSLSRGRLRQPGCDRDEYPPSASAGAGKARTPQPGTWLERAMGRRRTRLRTPSSVGGSCRRRVVNGVHPLISTSFNIVRSQSSLSTILPPGTLPSSERAVPSIGISDCSQRCECKDRFRGRNTFPPIQDVGPEERSVVARERGRSWCRPLRGPRD